MQTPAHRRAGDAVLRPVPRRGTADRNQQDGDFVCPEAEVTGDAFLIKPDHRAGNEAQRFCRIDQGRGAQRR
jgi:hypothetical protein